MGAEIYLVYVEDDEDDLLLMEEIMLKQNEVNLVAVSDGLELLEFLEDQRDGDLPCLIIMDSNTPRMNGIETARQLKKDEQFSRLRLVLLTTSPSRADQEYCQANDIAIITKPATFPDWEALSQTFIKQCRAV